MNYDNAGDEYFKWIMSYAEHLQTFGTFTFSKPVSKHWAFNIGCKLWRLTNEETQGKGFRKRNDGLCTVFAVEKNHVRQHLHLLQESHPKLTAECYLTLWRRAYGRWVSKPGVKIGPIEYKQRCVSYTVKEVTWEYPPFIYIPERYLD